MTFRESQEAVPDVVRLRIEVVRHYRGSGHVPDHARYGRALERRCGCCGRVL